MPPSVLPERGEFWIERKGGCYGLSPGTVREVSLLVKSRWDEKKEPQGSVQTAYRERKPQFTFPPRFPDMVGASVTGANRVA